MERAAVKKGKQLVRRWTAGRYDKADIPRLKYTAMVHDVIQLQEVRLHKH